jgi:hypothetical protein
MVADKSRGNRDGLSGFGTRGEAARPRAVGRGVRMAVQDEVIASCLKFRQCVICQIWYTRREKQSQEARMA